MGTAYTSENVNEENLDTHGPSGVNFARRSALESTMASTRTTTSRTGDAMLLRNLGSKEEAGFRPELASASAEELGVVVCRHCCATCPRLMCSDRENSPILGMLCSWTMQRAPVLTPLPLPCSRTG
jgi:hypothetical protein